MATGKKAVQGFTLGPNEWYTHKVGETQILSKASGDWGSARLVFEGNRVKVSVVVRDLKLLDTIESEIVTAIHEHVEGVNNDDDKVINVVVRFGRKLIELFTR